MFAEGVVAEVKSFLKMKANEEWAMDDQQKIEREKDRKERKKKNRTKRTKK